MSSIKDLISVGLDGSGTTGYISKWLDANSITDSVIYESSGNIGIGTSSPAHLLHLSNASYPNFRIDGGAVQFDAGLDTGGGTAVVGTNSNHPLLFKTNGSEKVRIDSSGNVGIGTTPAAWNSTSNVLQIGSFSSISQQHNGSVNVLSNAYESSASAFSFLASTYAGRYNIDPNNGVHSWYTAASGTAGTGVSWLERMRITSEGFLKASNTGSYIGTSFTFNEFNSNLNSEIVQIRSTDATYGNNILQLRAARNTTNSSYYFFSCFVDGVNQYRLRINDAGNVQNLNNSYGSLSDVKLKENITDATPKLDDLLKVKVRNYNLIGEQTKQIGVIAQELEEVFPSMIDESPDFEEQEVTDEEGNVTTERVETGTTTKSVKYSVFVPMLIKAMQEQQEIINDLKARIEILENK